MENFETHKPSSWSRTMELWDRKGPPKIIGRHRESGVTRARTVQDVKALLGEQSDSFTHCKAQNSGGVSAQVCMEETRESGVSSEAKLIETGTDAESLHAGTEGTRITTEFSPPIARPSRIGSGRGR